MKKNKTDEELTGAAHTSTLGETKQSAKENHWLHIVKVWVSQTQEEAVLKPLSLR